MKTTLNNIVFFYDISEIDFIRVFCREGIENRVFISLSNAVVVADVNV